jgi:D-3-phosphoglycerate dehydrogenase / 2-oxoglutarate reductase
VNGEKCVVVTSRSFGSGRLDLAGTLQDAGLVVVRAGAAHDRTELRAALQGAVAWIAGTGPVGADELDLAPDLEVLARYGVGTDAVDLDAARQHGVVVTNTPGANSEAVADHAVALLLAVLRSVSAGDRAVRAGDWSVRRGRELGGCTVGIVGFGRIGQGLARRLSGFGSTLLVHDPFVDEEAVARTGATVADLSEIAARADVVSLHAPGGQRLVDDDWLGRARPGLVVVNTARADLVDEQAVAAALRSGVLGGYAADTLDAENVGAASPLLAADLADRVVITPHLGAATVEAVDRMGADAVSDVLAVLAGRSPAHPVA